MPDMEYATPQALNRVEERLTKEIEATKTAIQKNSESIIKLEAMYQNLASLPAALTSLEKTMIGVQQTLSGVQQNLSGVQQGLDGMNSKIESMQAQVTNQQDWLTSQKASINGLKEENKQQNEHIARIDDKGKIDWIAAVKQNFWKVLLAIGALYYLGKDILSTVMKG